MLPDASVPQPAMSPLLSMAVALLSVKCAGKMPAYSVFEVRDQAVLPDSGVPIAAPVAGDIDPPHDLPRVVDGLAVAAAVGGPPLDWIVEHQVAQRCIGLGIHVVEEIGIVIVRALTNDELVAPTTTMPELLIARACDDSTPGYAAASEPLI